MNPFETIVLSDDEKSHLAPEFSFLADLPGDITQENFDLLTSEQKEWLIQALTPEKQATIRRYQAELNAASWRRDVAQDVQEGVAGIATATVLTPSTNQDTSSSSTSWTSLPSTIEAQESGSVVPVNSGTPPELQETHERSQTFPLYAISRLLALGYVPAEMFEKSDKKGMIASTKNYLFSSHGLTIPFTKVSLTDTALKLGNVWKRYEWFGKHNDTMKVIADTEKKNIEKIVNAAQKEYDSAVKHWLNNDWLKTYLDRLNSAKELDVKSNALHTAISANEPHGIEKALKEYVNALDFGFNRIPHLDANRNLNRGQIQATRSILDTTLDSFAKDRDTALINLTNRKNQLNSAVRVEIGKSANANLADDFKAAKKVNPGLTEYDFLRSYNGPHRALKNTIRASVDINIKNYDTALDHSNHYAKQYTEFKTNMYDPAIAQMRILENHSTNKASDISARVKADADLTKILDKEYTDPRFRIIFDPTRTQAEKFQALRQSDASVRAGAHSPAPPPTLDARIAGVALDATDRAKLDTFISFAAAKETEINTKVSAFNTRMQELQTRGATQAEFEKELKKALIEHDAFLKKVYKDGQLELARLNLPKEIIAEFEQLWKNKTNLASIIESTRAGASTNGYIRTVGSFNKMADTAIASKVGKIGFGAILVTWVAWWAKAAFNDIADGKGWTENVQHAAVNTADFSIGFIPVIGGIYDVLTATWFKIAWGIAWKEGGIDWNGRQVSNAELSMRAGFGAIGIIVPGAKIAGKVASESTVAAIKASEWTIRATWETAELIGKTAMVGATAYMTFDYARYGFQAVVLDGKNIPVQTTK